MSKSADQLLPRFEGCVLGLAIGDALGYPAEPRRRQQLLDEIGPEGITDFIALKDPRFSRPFIIGTDHPPGTYTDDTQMSLAVAGALIEAGDGPLDRLMEEMSRRFVEWSISEDNDRAPGETCSTGCDNLRRGVPWRRSGVPESKGNGSAMRASPIGLFYRDLDVVCEIARQSSLPTHGHDAALEASAAAALLVALALEDVAPDRMYAEIESRLFGRSADFDACLRKLPGLRHLPPEVALTREKLGEGWVAEEAVASALYCVWRYPDDYSRAVLAAVNTDGDSDSIAAITGSIMGARHGIGAIPRSWVRKVENSGRLHAIAGALWSRSRRRPD